MAGSSATDPGLLVLISLASGPRHGHAMMLDIASFAGVRLGPGTLYGAISRLEEEGLVEALAPEGRRRPYRLTDAGAGELRRRMSRLEPMLSTAQARVSGR
ncbi:MAG TPA: PadR family transcriptional regulator [Candidatus Limnocylindria bacterium]|nr:PadR family transcriptional regulator [Candidatus Limnocylindria bacterium]